MYLIVIGWMYVVFMMSITEHSIVAGNMTFLMYGVFPVAIIMYIGGGRQRRLKRQAEEQMRLAALAQAAEPVAVQAAPLAVEEKSK